jgi:poly(3-hydroxybutyrate) depolymerase
VGLRVHRRVACASIVFAASLTFPLASCTTEPATGGSPRATGTRSSDGGSGGATGETALDGASSSAPGDSGTMTSPDGGGGISPSNGSDKPTCKYEAHKTGLTKLQQAGGLSFHVYAPATYDAKVGHVVVVLMHSQDSDGVPELNGLWKSIADDEKLVLVAAKGSRASTTGNPDVGNWATADLNKVLDLMTDVDDCYNVFTKKHLLWGFSEGAFYGYLLGIGAAESFSGIAMGGGNTSFARQNGLGPSSAGWKIPVSHVHGAADFNPIAFTYQDRDEFRASGHVFTLHEHAGGHSITAAQVRAQYDDLKGSVGP